MTELFGTKIWQFDLLQHVKQGELDKLAHRVIANLQDEQIRKSNQGRSLRTKDNFLDGSLDKDPVGLQTINCYKTALVDYDYTAVKMKFSYWGIATYSGGYNMRHLHPDSLLSGVLYLSAPTGSGRLRLVDPRVAKKMETQVGRNQESQSHKDWMITPKDGLLVVFPSWLEHEVEVHRS